MQGFFGAVIRSFSGRALGAASALVASFVVTSTLTLSESGLFFLSLGFAIFFSHFLKFGLDTFVEKKCSIFFSDGKHREFLTVVLLSTAFCILGSLLFYATISLTKSSLAYEHIDFLVLALPAGAVMALLGIISFSLNAAGFVFTGSVTGNSLNYILFCLGVWLFSPDAAAPTMLIFCIACFVALATQVVAALLLYKTRGIKASEWTREQLKTTDYNEFYQTSWPIWIIIISQQLNQWGAQFISSIFVDEADLALLLVAMRIAMTVPMILIAVNMVVSPKFAAHYDKGEIAKIEEVLQKAFKLLAAVSLCVFIFIIVFGGDVLRIFGSEYVEAKYLLSILVCGQIINALTGPSGKLLMMSGFERDFCISSLLITFLGLVIAYFLASLYGVYGAAAATALTIAVQNIFSAYLVNLRMQINLARVYAGIFRRSKHGSA